MRHLLTIVVVMVAVTAGPLSGQCAGNGGNGQLTVDLQRLGSVVETRVDGGPGAFFAIFASGGIATTFVPNLGLVCIDVTSPVFYEALGGNLSANGSFSSFFSVPDTSTWENIVYWLQGIVADPGQPSGFALTAAVRKDYEPGDSRVVVGNLLFPRTWPRATVFDGTNDVFVSGGSSSVAWETASPLNRTEIYSPIARSFFPGPIMSTPRVHHTQTKLPDGRMLLAGGGVSENGPATASCAIFDPVTYGLVPTGSMGQARLGHEAVLLDDGRVLVMGGTTSLGAAPSGMPSPTWGGALSSAELYDPSTGTWSPTVTAMSAPRVLFQAAKLPDGRVMAISGITASGATGQPEGTLTCDLFDPLSDGFVATSGFPGSALARYGFQATVSELGNIVVTGGRSAVDPVAGTPGGSSPSTNLVFVTSLEVWIEAVSWPGSVGIVHHQSALLADGRLLVTGGFRQNTFSVRDVWGFDGTTATWSVLADLVQSRHGHATVIANDGSVLTLGGVVEPQNQVLASAVLYTP